jgi:hypothetical protein
VDSGSALLGGEPDHVANFALGASQAIAPQPFAKESVEKLGTSKK